MRTYAKSQGEADFDWRRFLDRKNKTDEEWWSAYGLARSWVTCACGNQCDALPRDHGEPWDAKLAALGRLFACEIHACDAKRAKVTLGKIERRVAKLLKEMS